MRRERIDRLHALRGTGEGYVPDSVDKRDYIYDPSPHYQTPDAIDLRSELPAAYDQGDLGSCTGNAIAAALQYERRKRTQAPDFLPSRLFIYYNERLLEGTADQDAGATIRDGMKVTKKYGACPEPMWPYVDDQLTVKPPKDRYSAGLGASNRKYVRVRLNAHHMRCALASTHPFVFGIAIFPSFESSEVASTGIVPIPDAGEETLGGHALLAVGYNHANQQFIVRNSWGAAWGLSGYCLFPYAYLVNPDLTNDVWSIMTTGQAPAPHTPHAAPPRAHHPRSRA